MNVRGTEEDSHTSVTFAFGHVVGLGIQEYITHHNLNETYWKCFLEWDCDLLDENEKQKKSFWLAMSAVEKFVASCNHGFMADWSLAYYQGKPATELSFVIHLPDGFTYKGFVDAVLHNDKTDEVMVLECKTSSATALNGAEYKNSFQGIGYSIVLDALFPQLSSYTVKYLVYKTKAAEFESLDFEKSYLDRALWIRTLLLNVDILKMYNDVGIYPQHGESCNDFYRECEFFGLCSLSTESLTDTITEEETQAIQNKLDTEFQISLSLNDLIASQLSKE